MVSPSLAIWNHVATLRGGGQSWRLREAGRDGQREKKKREELLHRAPHLNAIADIVMADPLLCPSQCVAAPFVLFKRTPVAPPCRFVKLLL